MSLRSVFFWGVAVSSMGSGSIDPSVQVDQQGLGGEKRFHLHRIQAKRPFFWPLSRSCRCDASRFGCRSCQNK